MQYREYLDIVSNEIRRRNLNDLEVKILDRIERGLSYQEIGENLNYDSNYIGDIAREIYGLIGQKHRVKVTRSNLFATLEKFAYADIEPDFSMCHGLTQSILNRDVLKFKKDNILLSVSLWWKLDVINKSLILKTKYPVIIDLSTLTQESLGTVLINASRQKQLPGDAILELLKILDNYFTVDR